MAAVLLVDDNGEVLDAQRALLESAGYVVEVATDGAEALHLLRNGFRPSVILLDIMMPGIDGFQFREMQMSIPELAPIPVIVYSGYTVDTRRLAQLRPVAFLQKPFDPERMLELIAGAARGGPAAVSH